MEDGLGTRPVGRWHWAVGPAGDARNPVTGRAGWQRSRWWAVAS